MGHGSRLGFNLKARKGNSGPADKRTRHEWPVGVPITFRSPDCHDKATQLYQNPRKLNYVLIRVPIDCAFKSVLSIRYQFLPTMPARTQDLPIRTGDSSQTAGTPKCLPVNNPGETFWQTTRHKLHDYRSTEELPEHSDIVIIGAGYAGVGTAYHLVKDHGDANRSIAILEARGACSGATGRNGGHARPDFYGHIPTYVDRAGARAGTEIAEFEIHNLRDLKKTIEQEKIDCDFTLTRSIDVWCNAEAAEKAKSVFDRMVSEGFKYMDDVIFYSGDNVEGVSEPFIYILAKTSD
jgi:hypothetical protein